MYSRSIRSSILHLGTIFCNRPSNYLLISVYFSAIYPASRLIRFSSEWAFVKLLLIRALRASISAIESFTTFKTWPFSRGKLLYVLDLRPVLLKKAKSSECHSLYLTASNFCRSMALYYLSISGSKPKS